MPIFKSGRFQKNEEGYWTSKWQTSILHVAPGFSTYSSNALESFFSKLDAFEPNGEEHRDISAVFDGIKRFANTQRNDKAYEKVGARPNGVNLMAPALMSGIGLPVVSGGLRVKNFRRTTVDKMIAACTGIYNFVNTSTVNV